MKIPIEYIRGLAEARRNINDIPLSEIEFTQNGIVVDTDEKTRNDFELTGLSNMDFITSNYYLGVKPLE